MCDRIEVGAEEFETNGRPATDNPGDPLFPIMPKVIEALRQRAIEKHGGEEGLMDQDEYAMLIESICGMTDDSQPVEQYDGSLGVPVAFVNQHQSSVGQLQWNTNLASIYTNPGNVNGARWCSGTLIANDLFLTAGHCFDQTGGGWTRPRVNGTANTISNAEIATNMHVNFNYQVDANGTLRQEVSFPVTALLEYRLGGLDFAIVRLGGNPGATWGTTQVSTTDAATGDMLCIMGHPAGVPKRVEAGPALAPQNERIRYDDIDTQGGNSGSGVLRASDGRIVGVHTNGGCNQSSPNGTNANFGMRIQAVIAASPILQNLTRPGGINTNLAADIGVATRFAADVLNTVRAADTINTVLARDLATTRASDTIGTLAALDISGSLKFIDDRKQPFRDKRPSDDFQKRPGSDGVFDPAGPITNPGLRRGGRIGGGIGETRPYVLANPHQSMDWAGGAESGDEEIEAQLAQLAELSEQYSAALEEVEAEYQALLEEYAQRGGGAGA